jgi:hypothetical protein
MQSFYLQKLHAELWSGLPIDRHVTPKGSRSHRDAEGMIAELYASNGLNVSTYLLRRPRSEESIHGSPH